MKLDETKLKLEVAKMGFNQKDLTELTNISQPTLSKIYNGGSCSVQTALKIAKALEIDLSQLVKE